MIVPVYLLLAALSALSEVASHHRTTRILFGYRTTDEGDDENLQRFSKIFLGTEKGG